MSLGGGGRLESWVVLGRGFGEISRVREFLGVSTEVERSFVWGLLGFRFGGDVGFFLGRVEFEGLWDI